MDARARENEITGVRTMYKTNRSLMNLGARDYSTFIKGPFITCVKYMIWGQIISKGNFNVLNSCKNEFENVDFCTSLLSQKFSIGLLGQF